MIVPAQIPNPYVKPKWQASVGVMESVVAYNCRKYGMPYPLLAMPMWEGAGNRALDLSGNGNHGTLTVPPEWVADGLDFDGSGDYVGPGENVLFNSTHSVSVSWRQRLTSSYSGSSTYPAPINLKSDQTTGFVIFWSTQPSYDGLNFGSNNNFLRYKTYLDLSYTYINKFSTVTLVFDGVNRSLISSYKLYIGGINQSLAASGFYAAIDNTNMIGRGSAATNYFTGNMGDVIIHNTDLSADQAKFIADNPYFMYWMPEELYGYSPTAVGAIMNQLQKANIGADLYNGAIIA